jgi:hypothetical protein
MRRSAAIVVVLGLMSLAVTASATGGTEHIKDKFDSISWAGSNGSLPWSGPWSEIGDDGDEKKGNVRVISSGNCASNNCIQLSALTTLLGQIGVVRAADTSVLEEASLSFDLETTDSLLGSELEVQANGGGGWVTVAEYQWNSPLTDSPEIDVSEFGSTDFQVRFRFFGPLLGGGAYIDNVEISGTLSEELTSTTTSTTTTTTLDTTTTTEASSSTTTTSTTTTAPAEHGDGATIPTTTTTVATTTTTTGSSNFFDEPGRTTTTTPGSNTGTSAVGVGAGLTDGPGSGGDTTPSGSGIRAAARGIQADFQGDLYGEARTVSSLSGVDFRAEYNMAVEVIEASWGWMVLLGLVVAYSIISGLDRRRQEYEPPAPGH